VSSIQLSGARPAGGCGSCTQTARKVSAGQPFLGPTAGAWMVTVAQRISTVAVRAGCEPRRGRRAGAIPRAVGPP